MPFTLKVATKSWKSVSRIFIAPLKQVPVDTDLQDIIKEISIMQQCVSPYVVRYYGSYFKNTDLWIVMEYCGAGSVSDIMRYAVLETDSVHNCFKFMIMIYILGYEKRH